MSFEKLLSNPIVKKLFLKQFKEIVKETNAKHIVLNITNDGSIEPVIYKDEIKILTVVEYDKLINAIKNNL